MEAWTIGLIAVLVVGLAVIVFGALSDRAKNRRAAVEMLAPPQRTIPQFRPDSPAPAYLSELQARRPPQSRPADLTATERDRLARQLKDPGTVTFRAGYASPDFVTDRGSSRAVLDSPQVLVCAERIESTREVLSLLEQFTLRQTALIIAAPSLSDEVRGTLEVNAIQQRLSLLAVLTTDDQLQQIADVTGAQVRTRSDLQAGYAWPEHLGTCGRWVSTAKASYVIRADAAGDPNDAGSPA